MGGVIWPVNQIDPPEEWKSPEREWEEHQPVGPLWEDLPSNTARAKLAFSLGKLRTPRRDTLSYSILQSRPQFWQPYDISYYWALSLHCQFKL